MTVTDENTFKMNETNRTEEYVNKFPTGKVPAYENDAGVYLFEANAIAHYRKFFEKFSQIFLIFSR